MIDRLARLFTGFLFVVMLALPLLMAVAYILAHLSASPYELLAIAVAGVTGTGIGAGALWA